MTDGEYEFDVALSFAGEDRRYVEDVAEQLSAADLRVFYDSDRRVDMWGKDLIEYFEDIYLRKAAYCVMFISRAYKEKIWTSHERRSALARALRERDEYVLPARFDDTEIPGVLPTIGYISLSGVLPEEFSRLVIEKVTGAPSEQKSVSAPPFRIPREPRAVLNPYQEATTLIDALTSELRMRCSHLSTQDIAYWSDDLDGRRRIRILRGGKPVYSLNAWLGDLSGQDTLSFYGTRGEIRSFDSGSNAWGKMQWSDARGAVVLELNDLSFLESVYSEPREFTVSEFVDAVWNEICDALDDS